MALPKNILQNNGNGSQGKKPFVITVCSGKGGVGKSFLVANLAQSFARDNGAVLIWDADLNFPNQHLLFGVEPAIRLTDIYNGSMDVSAALSSIHDNLFLLADAPALGERRNFNSPVILNTYNELIEENDLDVLIIDTSSGGSFEMIQCCAISDLVLVVVTDEPTSLLDAYGLIKLLLPYTELNKISLLVNNVIDIEDANFISSRLNLATNKFLNLKLDVFGYVPYDRLVRLSIIRQELFLQKFPNSEVTKSINEITDKINKTLKPKNP